MNFNNLAKAIEKGCSVSIQLLFGFVRGIYPCSSIKTLKPQHCRNGIVVESYDLANSIYLANNAFKKCFHPRN